MKPQQRSWEGAARFAAALALTSAASHLVRGLLDRIFYGDWGRDFLLRVTVPTVIFGTAWFLFALVILTLHARTGAPCAIEVTGSAQEPRHNFVGPWHAVAVAAVGALALAITAWLGITVNDEIFFSRLLAWVGPLIWVQNTGFRVASRLFPCRMEGSDLGCELYKWLPAFLLSNAAAYFPFLLLGALLYFRSARARASSARILRAAIKWGTALASAGLLIRLLIYGFVPDISLPNHVWDVTRIVWTVVDVSTGVLALMLLLLTPFYVWRTFNAIRKRGSVVENLLDLTWLAAFGTVALTLGYQYRF